MILTDDLNQHDFNAPTPIEDCIDRLTSESWYSVKGRVRFTDIRDLDGDRYVPKTIEVTWHYDDATGWCSNCVALRGTRLRVSGGGRTAGTRAVFEMTEKFFTDDQGTPDGDWPEWIIEFYRFSRPVNDVGAVTQ
jgi:hypothetical protein